MSKFGDLLGITPKPAAKPAPVVEETPVKKTGLKNFQSLNQLLISCLKSFIIMIFIKYQILRTD